MNKKIMLFYIYSSRRRNFSTNKLSYNNSCDEALENYKNEIFFKPIFNVENELLAPIIHSKNIKKEIKNIQVIFNKLPEPSFVKLWLSNELEKDKIFINAKNNEVEGINELLTEISKIKTIIKDKKCSLKGPLRTMFKHLYYHMEDVKRDNLEYGKTKGSLFVFYNTEAELNKKFKISKNNSLFTSCYIITFTNKYYYYIGSTTNIINRFKTHTQNINNQIEEGHSSLTEVFKHFLNSEINYSKSEKEYTLDFRIEILYLCTNYLNKFKKTYPKYKLSKGEWILLSKITDFIVKILEESLLTKFQPKLNLVKNVGFKYREWGDEYLQIYNREKEYSKRKNYGIYIQIKVFSDKKVYINKLRISRGLKPLKYETLNKDELIRISTLRVLCKEYNLNREEVLNNLNSWHTYEETNLENPLKIVEIT